MFRDGGACGASVKYFIVQSSQRQVGTRAASSHVTAAAVAAMNEPRSAQDRRARVRAAFLAAADRLPGPLVRAAFFAAADRCAALLRRALERACFDRERRDAADLPSRFNAFVTARERFADGRLPLRFAVLRRFLVADLPFLGIFTPARRAFDMPMAIACSGERAPCLPSRTWCISSRTNSPACVDGALPSSLSRLARSSVSFSGIPASLIWAFLEPCARRDPSSSAAPTAPPFGRTVYSHGRDPRKKIARTAPEL